MAAAKEWLSATEQEPLTWPETTTPKTLRQLGDGMADATAFACLPFAGDMEREFDKGPIVCRLLFFAEMCSSGRAGLGTYAAPGPDAPQTYAAVQQAVLRKRQLFAARAAKATLESAGDLAALLVQFASDGFTTRALLDFALPPSAQKTAANVTPRTESGGAGAAGASTTQSRPLALKSRDTSHLSPWVVTLAPEAARRMADQFFQFAHAAGTAHRLASADPGHVVALCILHSRLAWQKGKPLEFSRNLQHSLPKPLYVPVDAVSAPSPAHFVQQAARGGSRDLRATEQQPDDAPRLPGPRQCLLCGKEFVDFPALWRHCATDHHSWAEACKRVLWEADNLDDLPLTPQWKRRILQNFAQALTFSRPGGSHFHKRKACMRQLVGCAVCARVTWIDDAVPCHLFRDCPQEILAQAVSGTDGDGDSSDASVDHAAEDLDDVCDKRRGGQRLLQDSTGYYVRSAEDVDRFLSVHAYARAWPRIPREELHASSVQHPARPELRWLLNTRRVPMRRAEPEIRGGAAAEDGAAGDAPQDPACGPELPPCAGVADPDTCAWICTMCAGALCARKPSMPPFALCNWNWGGACTRCTWTSPSRCKRSWGSPFSSAA